MNPTTGKQLGFNKLKPTVKTTVPNTKLSKQQVLVCDLALSDYEDLINPKFKEWYCKMFYQRGEQVFRRFAAEAREGRNPMKLFSWKLRYGKT